MKKFIKHANQSFYSFQIISNILEVQTRNIINRTQLNYKGIELFLHPKNFGIYRTRIESISNSKNENTLIIAPDKNNLNKNCFQKLYNQDIKYNLNN